MRVLFTVSTWGGHYYCMVPLGWALQAAGHEVRVACPPGQAATVSGAGLVPVPVLDGPDLTYWARLTRYQEAVAGTRTLPGMPLHPDTGEPVGKLDEFDVDAASDRFMGEIFGALHRSYDAAAELARAYRPHLVVHDVLTPEGALAARLAGAPSVYHSLGLYGAAETEPPIDMGLDDPTESFARHGLAPFSREDMPYVIDPSPSLAVPPHGRTTPLPVRFLPYNGPGATPPAWLLDPPQGGRIGVLWGYSATAMYGTGVPVLRTAIETASRLGAEVVVTAGREEVDALGELPPNVRVLCGFPLHTLLETCDALFHHGGAGAMMTAAAAGVPQLALSLSPDQVVFGGRMAATGAVVSVPGLTASDEQVERAARTVLGEKSRAAAHALRDDIGAKPTPARLVPDLERLVRQEGRARPSAPGGTRPTSRPSPENPGLKA
ncbi:nucleotide disphospho-sugar-binding domain-containing protein [Streptomyces sp. NPDC050560]|uniref:nucleotide disphospho-sugar-binding domain-containing protein n=1 Tax=Streptomyces sp. NPDC050560 TaxID=3365630 RepID=UPI0037B55056